MTINPEAPRQNHQVEEVPAQKKKEETKPIMMKQLEKFIQTDNLSKEEREEACTFFKEESCLLTIEHQASRKHSDADALSQQYYPQEVSSNRVEINISAQKCREWLLLLVEYDAEECEVTETWWDSDEEFETFMMLEDVVDKRKKDIKLEEGKELRSSLIGFTTHIDRNRLGIQDSNLIKFQKLTIGYHMALRFTHLTRSYGYAEPLNECVVNADRNAQLRRNHEVIIVHPLEIDNKFLQSQ
ncbi:6069_t:CDS:2 [Cetraspora pellucida]|uniref:6069_t:CDS:1 n=1 Tax=Cetraspora pellucida TaxID=1433469 RepID=A0A9N9FUT9_9GLOM|nr:6069_t:CDS:2 [Cetraspora pellucida]